MWCDDHSPSWCALDFIPLTCSTWRVSFVKKEVSSI
jgi:hypothetical protein